MSKRSPSATPKDIVGRAQSIARLAGRLSRKAGDESDCRDAAFQRTSSKVAMSVTCFEARHVQRPCRRPSPGPAQAHADARQAALDQGLPPAAERNRHAALLRGDARPADRNGRCRDAAGDDQGADDRRQEAGVRADPARRRRLSRRHARTRAVGPRRPYRALPQSRDAARRSNIISRRRPMSPNGW